MYQFKWLWEKHKKFTARQMFRENQYKIFFIWYISPKDIEKVDRNYKGKSWKYQVMDELFSISKHVKM